jgi:hypothetical protein
MDIASVINLTAKDWDDILNRFSIAVKNKIYKKIPYNMWRQIKGLKSQIFFDGDTSILIRTGTDILLEITDGSLGTFLYYQYFYGKDDNVNSIQATSTDSIQWAPTTTASSIDYQWKTTTTAAPSTTITFNDPYTIKETTKENTKMKGFNFDFGPCTSDSVRISMYGLAVKNAAGVYVSYDANSKEIVDVDILNFDGSKFIYKIPVAISDIALGDIIVHARKPMIVVGIAEDGLSLTAIDVIAGEEKKILPTRNMFGFNFVTKIVSLFNMNGADAPTKDQPFGNMWPLLLMQDGDINPVMFMLATGSKMDTSNPMILYLAMNGDKDIDNLLPFLMMQK